MRTSQGAVVIAPPGWPNGTSRRQSAWLPSTLPTRFAQPYRTVLLLTCPATTVLAESEDVTATEWVVRHEEIMERTGNSSVETPEMPDS